MVFGAGGARDLRIVATLDDSGAVQGLKNLEGSIDSVTKKSEEQAKSADISAKALAGIAAAAITAETAFLGFALNRASELDDIQRGFESLQGGADAAAVSLEGLRRASQGFATDAELMKLANQAVLRGLPTEGFNEAAEAAVRLGKSVGIEAAQSIETFIKGVSSMSERTLKNIGIVVDSEDAYRKFAESIGTTADKLSDAGKQAAFFAAASEAARQKAADLGDAADTAGDAYEKLGVAFKNAFDQAATAVSSSQALGSGLTSVREAITALAPLFADLQKALAGVAGWILGVAGEAGKLTAQILNSIIPSTQEWTRALFVLQNAWKLGFTEARELATKLYPDIIVKQGQAKASTDDLSGSFIKGGDAADKYKQELEGIASAAIGIVEGSAAQQANLDKLRSGAEDAGAAYDDLGAAYLTASRAAAEVERAEKALSDALVAQASGVYESTTSIGILADTLARAREEVEKLSAETAKADSSLLGFGELGDSIGSSIVDGIGGALLDGTSIRQELGPLGGQIGSQLGQAIGGPLGASLGKIAGEIYGEAIAKLGKSTKDTLLGSLDLATGGLSRITGLDSAIADAFFGEHFETTARQNFEDFLEEITGENFLTRPGEEFGSGLFDDFLQNLQETAPEIGAAFSAAGAGFASLIENLDAGQAAAILSENLGGSIFELKALLDTAGISVEQLRESIIQMALDGSSSFAEAAGQLAGLGALAEEGIPGQIGATTTAINELFNASSNRVAVAALEALGDEAVEAGISLDQALANAGAAGELPAEQIQALADAIAATGVSASELADGNLERLIQVLANVESSGFALGDSLQASLDAIDSLDDRLANLPSEVRTTVVVDVQTTGDAAALQATGLSEVQVSG